MAQKKQYICIYGISCLKIQMCNIKDVTIAHKDYKYFPKCIFGHDDYLTYDNTIYSSGDNLRIGNILHEIKWIQLQKY